MRVVIVGFVVVVMIVVVGIIMVVGVTYSEGFKLFFGNDHEVYRL